MVSPTVTRLIFVKLAGNQDSHKISDEFEFLPDRISHFGVTCPCGRIKFSIDIWWNLQVQLTFQILEFFVILFLGTVRPGNLVHTWAVGGWIVHMKLFITVFSRTARHERLKQYKVTKMYTGIRLLLLIHPFISSFFFLSNFQHWNFCHIFLGNYEA